MKHHRHKGTDHRAQLSRLSKMEGQLRGIKKMIEEEKYCVDILTQIKAVRSALKSLENKILEEHINHCFINTIENDSKANAKEKIAEILSLLKKTNGL